MILKAVPPLYEALAADCPNLTLCRIIAQEKGAYRIVTAAGEKAARVSGRFMNEATCPADYPAVGDYCMADSTDSETAVIHEVLHRIGAFERKAAGNRSDGQIVAANIDTLFVCMSLNADFNLRRLERYLSVAFDSGASPVVLLTKADLCDCVAQKCCEVTDGAPGVPVLTVSSFDQESLKQLQPYLTKGKTVALIGSSGVGKSTLINRLLGQERLATDGLRRDDKGHHTTTRRELFCLPGGAMVIDTPGMREMGLMNAANGVDTAFGDIQVLLDRCRFNNCTHTTEPGCAVQQAIKDGALSTERWRAYEKLKKEADYAADSSCYLLKKKEKFKKIARINNQSNKGKDSYGVSVK